MTKFESHIAFCMDALLSNDDLIHWRIAEKFDATLGRCPETASTTVGIQRNPSLLSTLWGRKIQ